MQANKSSVDIVEKHEISVKDFVATLKNLTGYLRARWKLIVLCTVAGMLLGVGYSLVEKTTFIASTSFVLENTKKNDYASIASKFGISSGSSSSGLFQDDENIMTFLKSRTIIAQSLYSPITVDGHTELLADRYANVSGLRKLWKDNQLLNRLQFHTNPAERTILEDSVINLFYKQIRKSNLDVSKPDKEEDVIIATIKSNDEYFAKTFNEEMLENVISFYMAGQTKQLSENVDILQHQVDSVRGLLNLAISGVALSTEANPNPNPAFQRTKVASQRKMVDVQLNTAILEELVRNLEIAKVTLRKETPLVQIIDGPKLPLERKKTTILIGIIKGALLAGFIIFIILGCQFFFSILLNEQ